MKNNEKKKVVLDTNIVQALFMLCSLPDGKERLAKTYNQEQINSLVKLKNNSNKFQFYVTEQIFKEVFACEVKYPGIMLFMRANCKIQIPANYKTSPMYSHIFNLQKEYLQKDYPLRDKTRALHSAISSEIKDGIENCADAKIVAEKNVISGLPLFTLNEKHLVVINEAKKKNYPYRSKAILTKNKKYVANEKIEQTIIKNHIKSESATTFPINRIFDDEYTV